ncbi:hypothetical protein AB0K15_41085 [Amycolatopsis sp. NPDC049253]|uniref:hypothetical protein n=1 Tax=Amycolatopsis sp. NPDC049253 TaxID=3155274 RepID=UPI003427AA18
MCGGGDLLIRQAQTNITSTYPGTYGPDQWAATPPLTRLHYDEPMRKANGDTSISVRRAGFGDNYTVHPNPAQTSDCNKYPLRRNP